MKKRAGSSLSFGLCVVLSACGEDSLQAGLNGDAEVTGNICLNDLECALGEVCQGGICMTSGCSGQFCRIDEDESEVDKPDRDETNRDRRPPPVPGNDDNEILSLSLTGQWATEYHFDWSDYLGPLGDLGSPLDTLDLILADEINLFWISDIIDLYIPPWVGDVVHLLNNIVHFFQDVRIDATMTVTHDASGVEQIHATEIWHTASVMVIDGCPLGEMDAGYPDCALLSAPLNQWNAGFGTISALPDPFDGQLENGYPQAQLDFQQREVDMEIGKFVMFVVDEATQLATGGMHDSLQSAVSDAVDCAGLQSSIETLFGTPLPFVEVACEVAIAIAFTELSEQLDEVNVDWEMMSFTQSIRAYDDDGDAEADNLGVFNQMGTLDNGEFQALFGADLTGTWLGVRL
jgi:hypothetical protein